jgi:hypothetical protein
VFASKLDILHAYGLPLTSFHLFGILLPDVMLTWNGQQWTLLIAAEHRSRNCLHDIRSTPSTRFKKAASRAGTQIMQKTGQIERTVDREFAEEEGRYRT